MVLVVPRLVLRIPFCNNGGRPRDGDASEASLGKCGHKALANRQRQAAVCGAVKSTWGMCL